MHNHKHRNEIITDIWKLDARIWIFLALDQFEHLKNSMLNGTIDNSLGSRHNDVSNENVVNSN